MRLCLLALCLALLTVLRPPPASAQTPSSVLLKTFPLQAGKLLLDPVRPQLYATLPDDNSVAVINTDSNTLVTTLPTGSGPVDLAISPNHSRLYVANSGSTAAGVGVVDLTTLTVLPSLPTPIEISAIAAGLDNQLYVLAPYGSGNLLPGITQLDATTGEVETIFPSDGSLFGYAPGFLQINSDYSILYYGSDGVSPSYLASFDISTSAPTLLSHYGQDTFGLNGASLAVSHNGNFLVYSDGGPHGVTTSLIPADDLNSVVGTFQGESFGYGPAVFSNDDTELYEVSWDTYFLSIYSTQSLDQIAYFFLPTPDIGTGYTEGSPSRVTSLAVTTPNGYLYLALTYVGDQGEFIGNLLLFNTQPPPFFSGEATLSDGFFYLTFPNGTPFGYYNFDSAPNLYHSDLGFEYPYDAADGNGGIYLYDYSSETFFYTSPTLFPYLYNFAEESFLYYYPDTQNPGHYTTNPRYFYDFANGQIIGL